MEHDEKRAALRLEQLELEHRRQLYFELLGEALYEKASSMPGMREGNESLFEALESMGERRLQLQLELDGLESPEPDTADSNDDPTPNVLDWFMDDDEFAKEADGDLTDYQAGDVPDLSKEDTTELPKIRKKEPVGGRLFCPICGSPVPAGEPFCLECGYAMAEGTAAVESAVGNKTTEARQERKQERVDKVTDEANKTGQQGFCMGCGMPLEPGDAFCGYCGTKVSA